jgi:MFS family permease
MTHPVPTHAGTGCSYFPAELIPRGRLLGFTVGRMGSAARLYTTPFVLVCAVHFTGAMALASFILFPLYIRNLGGTEWTIGLLTAAGYAAAVVVRFPVGLWMDRVGRRPILLGAGVLHLVTCLLFPTAVHLDAWLLVLTLLHGIAGGVLFAAYFTYASDIVPALRRAQGIAIFGLCGLFPNGLAPFLGESILTVYGFPTFFVWVAIWAALSVGLTVALGESRDVGHHVLADGRPTGIRGALGAVGLPAVLFTTATFGFGVTALFTFWAPYIKSNGLGEVGSFFLAYATAGCLVRIVGGRLPDVVGARVVLLPALGLLATGLFSVPLLSGAPGGRILLGLMCGAAHGYIFPVLNAVAVDRAPVGSAATVVSVYTAMFDTGGIFGGAALGLVAKLFGYGPMYGLAAVVVVVGAAVCHFSDGALPSHARRGESHANPHPRGRLDAVD